ncbi:MAG: NAD(P)H-hydrate dehydratase [Deltaproteobacteria bacterium]|nr:MAG: NAD(P)H-hydrate dehydratase [Deltaproteobacteria bacterium]TNF31564.1 MAG: NAD(P)H-hydrate dehydratase [Deltaproteobacteria bacterium]
MKVVDLNEMRDIEAKTFGDFGFQENLVIENVGIRAADFIEAEILEEKSYGEIIVLAGKGNNGADALAAGRHLRNRGYSVRAFLMWPDDKGSDEYQKQLGMAANFGVKISELRSVDALATYFFQTQDEFLVIDGVFGTGFHPPLSNYMMEVFEIVNNQSSITISLDMPSGISGDNGSMGGNAIIADVTLAVGLPKTGYYASEGAKRSGEIAVLDVGFPKVLTEEGDKYLLTPERVADLYRERSRFAHKNTFGHCLVVGGSMGMTGALLMASDAALKVGTGLVTAATWEENFMEVTSRITPEIMTGLIPTEKDEVDSIVKGLKRWDSIVIGPGLGRSKKSRDTVLQVLNHFAGPVVVDADAIRVLSLKEDMEVFQRRKAPTILTPHMGEFADFAGVPKQNVLANPIEYLRELVDQTNSAIVMKDSCTYLGFPNGEVYINYFPNDGLASGGSGDVLAGMLGGLLAQYLPEKKVSGMFEDKQKIYKALCLGVAVHTLAGKHAAEQLGVRAMTAGSITEHLTYAFKELDAFLE